MSTGTGAPGAEGQPNYQAPQQSSKKKWIFGCLGIIVIGILVFVGCGALVVGSSDGDGEGSVSESAESSAPSTPDFPGAKEGDTLAQAGQTIALGSGVEATTAPIVAQTDALGSYLCSDVTIVNGSEDQITVSDMDFELQTPDGRILNTTIGGSENYLSYSDLIAGGSASGQVCFDAENVNPGTSYLMYSPTFSWSSDRAVWENTI